MEKCFIPSILYFYLAPFPPKFIHFFHERRREMATLNKVPSRDPALPSGSFMAVPRELPGRESGPPQWAELCCGLAPTAVQKGSIVGSVVLSFWSAWSLRIQGLFLVFQHVITMTFTFMHKVPHTEPLWTPSNSSQILLICPESKDFTSFWYTKRCSTLTFYFLVMTWNRPIFQIRFFLLWRNCNQEWGLDAKCGPWQCDSTASGIPEY